METAEEDAQARRRTALRARPAGRRQPAKQTRTRPGARARKPAAELAVRAPRTAEDEPGRSLLRVLVGSLSLGGAELVRGLRELEREAGPLSERHSVRAEISVGMVLVGLAVEAPDLLRSLGSRLPGAQALADATRRTGTRLLTPHTDTLRRLSATGRLEEARGRRMVEILVREAVAGSIGEVTDRAIAEVAHSPEVALLVRVQSTTMSTEALGEARGLSEIADDRLEGRVRSWLRLRPSRAGAGPDGRAPAAGDRSRRA